MFPSEDLDGRWSYVPMPVDSLGRGPAKPEDTVRTEYEVWNWCYQTIAVCDDEATARRIVDDHNTRLRGVSSGNDPCNRLNVPPRPGDPS